MSIIIEKNIKKSEIVSNHLQYFHTMTKAVVDIDKSIIAIDSELHSDLEFILLENGSNQSDLWGINLYPFNKKDDFIEFNSLINIRPYDNNPTMDVKNLQIREKIKKIVFEMIDYDS